VIINFTRVRLHEDGDLAGQTETYRILQNRHGKYLLGDPKFGGRKHLKVNRVEVDTREEAAKLVEEGFALWMKGDLTGQQNLISAAQITIERGTNA
jgi:hypothetical protein